VRAKAVETDPVKEAVPIPHPHPNRAQKPKLSSQPVAIPRRAALSRADASQQRSGR
jgi:hypothetical protein